MRTKRKIQLVAVILLLTLVGILILQNSETTRLRLFAWEIETSRIILFSILALFGYLAGLLTGLLVQRHRHKNASEQSS